VFSASVFPAKSDFGAKRDIGTVPKGQGGRTKVSLGALMHA